MTDIAKDELRKTGEQAVLVLWAGVLAEAVLSESGKPDCIDLLAYHESAHYCVSERLRLPVAGISVRRTDRQYYGIQAAIPESLEDETSGVHDGAQAGGIIQGCRAVGVELSLDDMENKSRGIVISEWPRIQRMAAHVASICRSQNGTQWHVIVTSPMIERLFWTPAEWAENYGEGVNE